MRLNPEIQRYLWEDFSLHRIIAMPAVFLAIMLLAYNVKPASVASVGVYGFMFLVFLWGGSRAASCIVEEINGNTWDNHRLSPTSAQGLCFGKLFGSTLYAWYGGLIGLLGYVIGASWINADNALRVGYVPIPIAYNLALLLGTALLCQAIAMLMSLQTLHMRTRFKRFNSINYLICGASIAYATFGMANTRLLKTSVKKLFEVEWYGKTIPLDNFVLISLLIFLAWAVLGIIRSMRAELQVRDIPWVWGAFILFLVAYISGFDGGEQARPGKYGSLRGIIGILSPQQFGMAFMVTLLLAYVGIFSEMLNLTRYRMLHYYWQQKSWRKVGELMPRWVVSVGMVFITGLLVVAGNPDKSHTLMFSVGMICFLIRDICILHFFLFAANNRRAYFATTCYLLVLYILMPSIMLVLKSQSGMLFFVPFYPQGTDIQSALPALLQCSLAIWLLAIRWRKANAQMNANESAGA